MQKKYLRERPGLNPGRVAGRVRSILDDIGPLRYMQLVGYYCEEFKCCERKAASHLDLLTKALQKGGDYDLRGIQRTSHRHQTWFQISAGQVVQEKADASLKIVEELVEDMTNEALAKDEDLKRKAEDLKRLQRQLEFVQFETERMREKIRGLTRAGMETRLELGLAHRQLEDLREMARILAERPSSK